MADVLRPPPIGGNGCIRISLEPVLMFCVSCVQASAGVKPWPVHCALPGSGDSCIPALAEAAAAAKAEGHPPRAVLLCHPNNPVVSPRL